MQAYRAPVADTAFVLDSLLDLESVFPKLEGYTALGRDEMQMILKEAAKFCESKIHPINQLLDEKGCSLADGKVTTPEELKQAWLAYAEAGWPGIACDTEHGGQGLPRVLYFAIQEYVSTASIAFGDYAGLNAMAYTLYNTHASETLKNRYLGGLADGSLAATMCMTEPQCGTDVGLIKTRAVAGQDEMYAITGTKIFISGGDHDLTDNIIHAVLARIDGAETGPRGLSLFLVPKLLADGRRNKVSPVRLEKKMGYHGSATCQMAFDDAQGWLVGEEGRGLNCMFVMVNLARLMTASQGLCSAELACQNATAYALERLQGRSLPGARYPDKPADPIIEHPDVRRMLLSTRAFTEVARATYLWMALEMDIAEKHRDAQRRKLAEDRLALFTPVVKSVMSDFGFSACNDCMQIFGGHGYIRDNGMEQLVRDVRLSQIQEGANGILALDLVMRRVFGRQRGAYDEFIASCRSIVDDGKLDSSLLSRLADVTDMLEEATGFLEQAGKRDASAYGAAGVEYQRLFGLVLFAWMWMRILFVANSQQHLQKQILARYFMERILPMARGHLAVLLSGHESIEVAQSSFFSEGGR